ncbi:MAG: glycosyltransferase [Paracoccaceae bacterium]
MPSILFAHTNFPAQFGALGDRLARAGWDVAFATQRKGVTHSRIRVLSFPEGRDATKGVHPYLASTERAVITGQSAARVFFGAHDAGLKPDIVMAHSGWGAGLFAKDVWPDTVYVPYFEWWYNAPPIDSVFLGETTNRDAMVRQRVRNTPILIDLAAAEFGLVPTRFQAVQFPPRFAPLLRVIHDGIDTEMHKPAETRPERVGELDLRQMPELVSYATRGMEPQRGFPQFMRALALLQKRRPGLHAIIAGEDRVAYGTKLPEGDSWKARMLAELDLDLSRVHFTGLLGRADYVALLQATGAHVYLTAPFVLSWSALEAMAVGAPIVANRVAPVEEYMTDGQTARLVDFHRPQEIANAVEAMLDDRETARRLGQAARAHIVENYRFEDIIARKTEMLTEALGPRLR